MKKYMKGAIVKCCDDDRVFWLAIITYDGLVLAVEVHGDTKKEARRLRKIILKALNEDSRG